MVDPKVYGRRTATRFPHPRKYEKDADNKRLSELDTGTPSNSKTICALYTKPLMIRTGLRYFRRSQGVS